ncbi:hypothetical protein Aperf_G00000089090 [Anoplocephala perfoliata]
MIGRFLLRYSSQQPRLSFSLSKILFYTSSLLSNHVRHVPPNTINWYPGHMQKGLKAIFSHLGEADVVIEIHDARIPLTGRCQFIKDTGQIRPHILLMSKVDLAEPIKDVNKHKTLISSDSNFGPLYLPPAEILFANLKHPEKQKRLLHRLLASIAELASSSPHGMSFRREFTEDVEDLASSSPNQRSFNAIVLGLPNCGKSTLINALRSIASSASSSSKGSGGGRGRRAAVPVGKDAGRTRSVSGPIVIARDFPVTGKDGTTQEFCTIRLIDTPGILEPKAQTLCGQLSLSICGAVDWGAVDKILLADYLLFCLNARSSYEYVRVFGLPGPTRRVDELLAWVAARRHLARTIPPHAFRHRCPELEEAPGLLQTVSSTTSEPDLDAAATHLLRAFNEGILGRITILPNVDEKRAEPFFVPVSTHLYRSNH